MTPRKKAGTPARGGVTPNGVCMNENELLSDVAAKVGAMYRAAQEDAVPVEPEIFGQRVADMLADDWGGINVYIPKGKSDRLRRRNAHMWRDFSVKKIPLADIARKYGLSEQRAYAVLAAERERNRQKQHSLPGMFL